MLEQRPPETKEIKSPAAQQGTLFDKETLEQLKVERQQWEETAVRKSQQRLPERDNLITTSGVPINRVYTPQDNEWLDYYRDMGLPGEYPYTRGVQPTMYRAKPWTMRMFAGFGTAEDTNKRFKYLLSQGQTGLSTAFDMPTLYGYDTDHALAAGEFGKCGVAISSLVDMEILFAGLPLDKITTSMTINSPASVIWAMYIVNAEKCGFPMKKLGGTLQNDILKEYSAQKEFLFPPEPSLRLVTDTIEFGTHYMPRWNTISISGYHIREAGATAVQELALPTEKAVLIALRTQQIIASESGVVNTVDPLGGSYFVERLTDETERATMDYLNRIDALGGVLACIQNGFFQREIAESAYRYQQEIEQHQRTIVGINDYVMGEEIKVPTLYVDYEGEKLHLARLQRVRRERNQAAVHKALDQ